MTFEEYLISKKIDSKAFQLHEPEVWNEWKLIFEQMHPNSFTVQKLNMINPIRRKYQLPIAAPEVKVTPPENQENVAAAGAKPGRPVMKPRPKI